MGGSLDSSAAKISPANKKTYAYVIGGSGVPKYLLAAQLAMRLLFYPRRSDFLSPEPCLSEYRILPGRITRASIRVLRRILFHLCHYS